MKTLFKFSSQPDIFSFKIIRIRLISLQKHIMYKYMYAKKRNKMSEMEEWGDKKGGQELSARIQY